MAPKTRSAENSPRTRGAVGSNTTASPSPTRKVPHCTKCHRPRAGHPRQGCPNVPDTAALQSSARSPGVSSASTTRSKKPDSRVLTSALNNLYIDVPNVPGIHRSRKSAPANLEKQPSLYEDDDDNDDDESNDGSGSSTSVISVEQLCSGSGKGPGLFSSPVRDGNGSYRSSNRAHMPCSMGTPWTSFNGSGFIMKSEESAAYVDEPEMVYSQTTEPASSQPQVYQSPSVKPPSSRKPSTEHQVHQAKPLTRSFSSEERVAFMYGLSKLGQPIMISRLNAEVEEIRKGAVAAKVHSLAVPNTTRPGETWVILGKDVYAVEELAETLKGIKANNRGIVQKAGLFTAGAAAAFAGLAYS